MFDCLNCRENRRWIVNANATLAVVLNVHRSCRFCFLALVLVVELVSPSEIISSYLFSLSLVALDGLVVVTSKMWSKLVSEKESRRKCAIGFPVVVPVGQTMPPPEIQLDAFPPEVETRNPAAREHHQ